MLEQSHLGYVPATTAQEVAKKVGGKIKMKVGCGKAAQVQVAFPCTASALDQPVLGSPSTAQPVFCEEMQNQIVLLVA